MYCILGREAARWRLLFIAPAANCNLDNRPFFTRHCTAQPLAARPAPGARCDRISSM